METTNKDKIFQNIFKNSLKIDARTLSIKTLLSERNLKRIDYSPYYQRNYVWDNIKQTFFIESVILGTEIPPLILFKSGISKIEVIDGRQRFETLKRFKENDLILSSKGLMSLTALSRKSFNTLTPTIQEIFWNSHIRVFEFEIINEPNIDEDIKDKIKKEIFRRYNTGITPLTSVEIDSAKYDEDKLSELFENDLINDKTFYRNVKNCFFYHVSENPDLIKQMVNYLRRCYVLTKFPISKYATGSERTEIIELLYNFSINSFENDENIQQEWEVFKQQINLVVSIHDNFISDPIFENRLIYECILWSIRILNEENILFNFVDKINLNKLKEHYTYYINEYSQENPHFYKSIIDRFSNTAMFFKQYIGFDFEIFLRNTKFKEELKNLRQSDSDLHNEIKQLDTLRINKPSPISKYIDELRNEVKSTKYLIRPSYQRQEKITILKASSIIESILLNIKLPPIFIYQRDSKNKEKEVIDGQQRLLSILGFLGEDYVDEKGTISFSKNNSFRLKGLKILYELNGKSYNELDQTNKDKILDFILDEIIIEESLNREFEPTDLFIRLNQKPYPIKQNSFEMWNSTVDKDVIQKVKTIAESHSDWFYIKEIDLNKRTDRMENEELITILSYISYNNRLNKYDKILGLFSRQDRITCRVKDKNALADFLVKLEKNALEKDNFIESLNKTDKLIILLKEILKIEKFNDLNKFLNVKQSQTFRRSFQDFYIIWIIFDSIPIEKIISYRNEIIDDLLTALNLLRNSQGALVDDKYLEKFISFIDTCNNKYIKM